MLFFEQHASVLHVLQLSFQDLLGRDVLFEAVEFRRVGARLFSEKGALDRLEDALAALIDLGVLRGLNPSFVQLFTADGANLYVRHCGETDVLLGLLARMKNMLHRTGSLHRLGGVETGQVTQGQLRGRRYVLCHGVCHVVCLRVLLDFVLAA